MNKYKTDTRFYLDKSQFGGKTAAETWNKLKNYIASHESDFDRIVYDNSALKVTCTSHDFNKLNEFVKMTASDFALEKCLVRTCLLNTTLDKANKSLMLSNDNTENFEDYNTIIYYVQCADDFNERNSVFFHESALVNYAQDEYSINLVRKVLGIIAYTESYSNGFSKDEIMYVCYDLDTNKILTSNEYTYPTLNDGKDASDVSTAKSRYNAGTLSNLEIQHDGVTLRNFKFAKTMFKMTSESDFINFKSFVSAPIYNTFIENAKKDLE